MTKGPPNHDTHNTCFEGSHHSGNVPPDATNDDSISSSPPFHMLHEFRLLFSIAAPTVGVQFSLLALFTQSASSVGLLLGTEPLAGFSLAALAGNATCLSIIVGTLSAGDTLQPRAVGIRDYAEVGRLAVRGFFACVLVLSPCVALLFLGGERAMETLGQDPVASELAARWIKIYVWGVPAVVVFRATQRFLSCQGIVMPLFYAAAAGCFLVQPLLLRLLVRNYGFVGSGAAVVLTQWAQACFIVPYLMWKKPHVLETWPGISRKFLQESLRPAEMAKYLKLGLGGVLSFSEWWFWEAVCFRAGRFGAVPLCAHSIAYQIIPLFYMLSLGIAIGLVVRIGTVLPHDVAKAKKIATGCYIFSAVLAASIAAGLYVLRVPAVDLFTDDPEVAEEARRMWPGMCVFVFVQHLLCISSGIMRALGMQWNLGLAMVAVLWCGTLPIILMCSSVGDIWRIMPCAYAILDLVIAYRFVHANWEKIGANISSKGREVILDESTKLLDS